MHQALDQSFGPQLSGSFDFTLLFEQAMLSVLPSALLLSSSPIYLYGLTRRPLCVRAGCLLWIKLAAAASLLCVEVANAVFWSLSPIYRTNLSLAAASLSCLNAICIATLLQAEHRRSFRPSTLLSVYLTITILFDTAKARSLFNRPGLQANASLTVAVVILKFVILLLEEVSKRSLLHDKFQPSALGSEVTSGFWNRSLFLWLNSTLYIGFRRILRVEDLEPIGPRLGSRRLLNDFTSTWTKGFKFCQPFLLQSVVAAVGRQNLSREVVGGLIGATVLVYLGMAVTHAYYTHLTFRFITMLRGALVSSILNKALHLDLETAKKSAAVTLMSTDIDAIALGLTYFHDIWTSVIELALGIYFLATIVGGASILVVLPALERVLTASVSTMASVAVARGIAPARVAWNNKIQIRVATTSGVLSQVKGIKMSGLAPVVSEHIQHLREVEMEYSKKLRLLTACIHAITPVVVIAGGLFWTKFSGGMSATQAFTTLSIISLVSNPLATLLSAYPQFASILGCFDRIQQFLLLAERADQRLMVCGTQPKEPSTEVSPPPGFRDCGSYELQAVKKVSWTHTLWTADTAVEVSNASIAVSDAREPILRSVNLRLPRSSLTMVIGPVGSGKSTLLKAVLGEAHLCEGFLQVGHEGIAYCGQTPWLRNITVRENILGNDAYDSRWYETVVHACLLEDDIRAFPEGDRTLAGSGGVTLSGGQKQRLALARAVYARKPLVLLDDVFSSLDRGTSQAVLARLLGTEGILRKSGATVLLATHMVEHLDMADKVVCLDGNGAVSVITNPAKLATKSDFQPFVPKGGSGSNDTGPGTDSSPGQQVNIPLVASQTASKAIERQRGDFTLYFFYLKSMGIVLVTLWLFIVAFSVVANKMPQIWVRIWLDNDPSNNWYFAGYAALGVSGFLSWTGGFMYGFTPSVVENDMLELTFAQVLYAQTRPQICREPTLDAP
ncbi:ABC transporter, transmembrane domain, type 1 [Tolypocladium paradoxum]|uniref:ABC transporter, transmembrane domain, type 1 n=1 Tax=Tolypocladium paradoxum TaxID=94208 RepID=A0A2S4L0E6_9HYPO|nr:ABC transporter, transmembrane domain, type 1 [Tolypocladium paradoxum]